MTESFADLRKRSRMVNQELQKPAIPMPLKSLDPYAANPYAADYASAKRGGRQKGRR